MALTDLLDRHGISQVEFSAAIGLEAPTLNKKLKGTRAWKLGEVTKALDFLRKRVNDDSLSFEQVFGPPKRKRTRRAAA